MSRPPRPPSFEGETTPERSLQRTLALQEKTLGREHPHVLSTLRSLALLYLSQQRISDALPLLEQALTASERHLRQECIASLDARLVHALPELQAEAECLYSLAVAWPKQARVQQLALAAALLRKSLSPESLTQLARAIFRGVRQEDSPCSSSCTRCARASPSSAPQAPERSRPKNTGRASRRSPARAMPSRRTSPRAHLPSAGCAGSSLPRSFPNSWQRSFLQTARSSSSSSSATVPSPTSPSPLTGSPRLLLGTSHSCCSPMAGPTPLTSGPPSRWTPRPSSCTARSRAALAPVSPQPGRSMHPRSSRCSLS